MPSGTPRERLTEAVQQRFRRDGFAEDSVVALSILAVDAFYANNRLHTHYPIVAETAMGLIVDIVPSFATHMRAAFEQAHEAMVSMNRAAQVVAPWSELASRLSKAEEPATPGIEFDASGLPVNTNPEFDTPLAPADRQHEPCIEEGCGEPAVPGTAFCRDCMPQPTSETGLMAVVRDSITGDSHEYPVPPELLDVADQVSLEDTGRLATHFRPYQRPEGVPADAPAPMFQMSIQVDGEWAPLGGVDVTSIEVTGSERVTPPEVIELTEREWYLSAARSLRKLGCTYGQLKQMAERDAFPSGRHHSLWFNIGDLVNLELLDRANFVLDNLARGDAFDIDMDDAAIQRAEERYPEDRITGAPHHYILNGDHSACGCGGHDPSCQTHDIPAWRHKPTLCRVRRQLCLCTPRHTYSEPCPEYHENLADLVRPPVVGRTAEGEEVRGPAAG